MKGGRAAAEAVPTMCSAAMRRLLSGLTANGVAVIRDGSETVTISTRDVTRERLDAIATGLAGSAALSRGIGASVCRELVWDEPIRRILSTAGTLDRPGHRWRGFACAIQGGVEDRVALELEADIDTRLVRSFLEKIWPVLREDCLQELQTRDEPPDETDPLFWMVLDRMDVGLVILDGAGLMYRVNVAGRHMLEEATVLKRGRGGIFAAVDAESRRFRKAVADCASSGEEMTLCMPHAKTGRAVPVTVSRFRYEGAETRYVVVTVPRPPDPKRIEEIARTLGLTPSEARVARYMQIGLSNRDAAALAGYSENTFSTYAKRVLSKLNVSGRAEMAQLLTWQAAGGRLS